VESQGGTKKERKSKKKLVGRSSGQFVIEENVTGDDQEKDKVRERQIRDPILTIGKGNAKLYKRVQEKGLAERFELLKRYSGGGGGGGVGVVGGLRGGGDLCGWKGGKIRVLYCKVRGVKILNSVGQKQRQGKAKSTNGRLQRRLLERFGREKTQEEGKLNEGGNGRGKKKIDSR